MLHRLVPDNALGDNAPVAPLVVATPYQWIEGAKIAPRPWLYGDHLIRGYVSVDVAAGGIGKSSLKIGEAISMASGRSLYNKKLYGRPLRVWLYNLEDDMDELQRRIAATCQFFGVHPSEITGRLFVDSGMDRSFTIASQGSGGTIIHKPIVEACMAQIAEHAIDVMIVDPFVSSHQVNENDNKAIDLTMKQGWKHIAYHGRCAVNLVHHISKPRGEEVTADHARGASALVNAARSAVVYNPITKEEAQLAKVDVDRGRRYFRVTNEKSNLAPPPERADWYSMTTVELANGDKVGVAAPFVWPSAEGWSVETIHAVQHALSGGEWREDQRADNWAGKAVASALNLDVGTPEGRSAIKQAIADLVRVEALVTVQRRDANRNFRLFVVPASVDLDRVVQTDGDHK